MPEVCTYGGSPGIPSGYAILPHQAGDWLTASRAELGAMTSLRFAVRARFDFLGRVEGLAGHEQIGSSFRLNGDRTLQIWMLGSAFASIGNVPSTAAVPALAPGVDVWLRGAVVLATALCTYEYSYDAVTDVDDVSWLPVGVPVVGTNAGVAPVLNQTDVVVIGADSIIANEYSGTMGGRLYAFAEWDSGVKTVEITGSDWPDNSANSFVSTSGHTITVARAGSPATELVHAGGSTYGDGHYGLCDQRNVRGCAPASVGSTPTTVGAPFDPSCHDQEPC